MAFVMAIAVSLKSSWGRRGAKGRRWRGCAGAMLWSRVGSPALNPGNPRSHSALCRLNSAGNKCVCLLFPPAVPEPKMTGAECVEGMASGLYEELFAAVVSLINRYQRAAGHRGWGRQPLLQGLLRRRGMEQGTDSCWKNRKLCENLCVGMAVALGTPVSCPPVARAPRVPGWHHFAARG